METLIIILIVVMIAQTVLFIYNNIIETTSQKQSVALQELVKNAQINFTAEKEQMLRNYEVKDGIIKQWIDKCNKLEYELSEARKVNGLLKNRTAYIEWLKDSFNQQAEGNWDVAVFADIKEMSQRRCYVEGMKAGAEWVCGAVGVKTEFEIDGRFDDGEKKEG